MTNKVSSPVVIGGIGGSGTRIIAQILKELGFYMGSDLNHANDNLWFTLLFKRKEILLASDDEFEELVKLFVNAMTLGGEFKENQIALIKSLAEFDRALHPSLWLRERADSLLAINPVSQTSTWGWKEPNTHIVIDRLVSYLPNMKYIHVMRNGLDMAYSENQNQLLLWGNHFLETEYTISPYYSLKYWCAVHKRVLNVCGSMGKQFYLLNYDDFCLDTKKAMMQLLSFLEIDSSDAQINSFCHLVNNPGSIGRFKAHDVKVFDPADILFVEKLGFDVVKSGLKNGVA